MIPIPATDKFLKDMERVGKGLGSAQVEREAARSQEVPCLTSIALVVKALWNHFPRKVSSGVYRICSTT